MQELLADEVALVACERDERRDLLGDPLLLLERERDRRGRVRERVCGASTPGMATSWSASSRYWTSIIAWFRSSTAWR